MVSLLCALTLEKKEIIIFDKSNISKVKKRYNICEIFIKNDEKIK